MKLVIASDIHGAADGCARLLDVVDAERPDRVMLLGDLLYHGPRNDLPHDYAPKRVVSMLNERAEVISAVRGNCEAEVDQMVLGFPCMATYLELLDPATNTLLFFTHGHVYGPGLHNSVRNLPRLAMGDVLVYGHTHIKVDQPCDEAAGVRLFNPGSVGIPKDGTRSCGIYEDGLLRHVLLD